MNLARLAEWLWAAFQSLVIHIHNVGIRIVNKLIDGLAAAAVLVINALPDYTPPTPGQLIDNIGFLSALNWVVPVSFIVDCFTMMIMGYLAFQIAAPILRWVKVYRG